mmetsp:Transcript_24019/g.58319  ORF Transcript_24019/g.58319 Transcript_24019/m.58319 type:complete len:597 (-) Transcript_24019:48-1838(-)
MTSFAKSRRSEDAMDPPRAARPMFSVGLAVLKQFRRACAFCAEGPYGGYAVLHGALVLFDMAVVEGLSCGVSVLMLHGSALALMHSEAGLALLAGPGGVSEQWAFALLLLPRMLVATSWRSPSAGAVTAVLLSHVPRHMFVAMYRPLELSSLGLALVETLMLAQWYAAVMPGGALAVAGRILRHVLVPAGAIAFVHVVMSRRAANDHRALSSMRVQRAQLSGMLRLLEAGVCEVSSSNLWRVMSSSSTVDGLFGCEMAGRSLHGHFAREKDRIRFARCMRESGPRACRIIFRDSMDEEFEADVVVCQLVFEQEPCWLVGVRSGDRTPSTSEPTEAKSILPLESRGPGSGPLARSANGAAVSATLRKLARANFDKWRKKEFHVMPSVSESATESEEDEGDWKVDQSQPWRPTLQLAPGDGEQAAQGDDGSSDSSTAAWAERLLAQARASTESFATQMASVLGTGGEEAPVADASMPLVEVHGVSDSEDSATGRIFFRFSGERRGRGFQPIGVSSTFLTVNEFKMLLEKRFQIDAEVLSLRLFQASGYRARGGGRSLRAFDDLEEIVREDSYVVGKVYCKTCSNPCSVAHGCCTSLKL